MYGIKTISCKINENLARYRVLLIFFIYLYGLSKKMSFGDKMSIVVGRRTT